MSLRDKSGAEKHVIERSAPIWSVQWNPSREEAHDLLAVACWDQTISFYDVGAQQHGKGTHLEPGLGLGLGLERVRVRVRVRVRDVGTAQHGKDTQL